MTIEQLLPKKLYQTLYLVINLTFFPNFRQKKALHNVQGFFTCGEGGIRTLGTVSRTPV